jgi:hypothetical protein
VNAAPQDSVLVADVAKVSVTTDDVRGVLAICVSIPYLTLLTHADSTPLTLSNLTPLCQNAVSRAVHYWLSGKSESALPLTG